MYDKWTNIIVLKIKLRDLASQPYLFACFPRFLLHANPKRGFSEGVLSKLEKGVKAIR
jgi:hypothetical protein